MKREGRAQRTSEAPVRHSTYAHVHDIMLNRASLTVIFLRKFLTIIQTLIRNYSTYTLLYVKNMVQSLVVFFLPRGRSFSPSLSLSHPLIFSSYRYHAFSFADSSALISLRTSRILVLAE